MDKSPFGVGFVASVKTNPYGIKEDSSVVKIVVSICAVVALVVGMLLFRQIVGVAEPFLDLYKVSENSKTQSIEIHEGWFVFFAPITTEDAYIGSVPENCVLRDISVYSPKYREGFSETGSYIGIKASELAAYQSDEFHFSKDKDGIVWIPTNRISTLN